MKKNRDETLIAYLETLTDKERDEHCELIAETLSRNASLRESADKVEKAIAEYIAAVNAEILLRIPPEGSA